MTHNLLPFINYQHYKRYFVNAFFCLCFLYGSSGIAAESVLTGEESNQSEASKLFITALSEYQLLNEQIYLGAIYLPLGEKEFVTGSAMRLEIRMAVEETSARRFTRMWMDSISLNASREQRERLIDQIQTFSEIYQQTLQHGDRIIFEYIPQQETTYFFHNEVKVDAIPGEEFFNLLLSTWVGERPISTEFKKGLISTINHGIETPAIDAFYILDYDESRYNEVDMFVNQEKRQAETRLAEEAREQELERLAQAKALEDQALEEEKARLLAEKAREEAQERLRLAQQEEERIQQEQEALAKVKFEQEQQELRTTYTGELITWIRQYVVYPEAALRRGMQGRVEIEVSSDRDGNLLSREIIVSSGVRRLDQAAHDSVISAEPLPSMPSALEGESVSIVMPIAFILDN